MSWLNKNVPIAAAKPDDLIFEVLLEIHVKQI
jgi:hypothetical protein